jgi:hypothetical protein
MSHTIQSMKVTAIIPDKLAKKITTLTKTETTVEALIVVLREWINARELTEITKKIRRKPLKFATPNIAKQIRENNRKST